MLEKLSDPTPTQVLVKGMKLNDILNPSFLDELKQRFGEDFPEIACSTIIFQMLQKDAFKVENNVEKNMIEFQVAPVDFLRFEHPTRQHEKEGTLVITTNRKGHLERILKNDPAQ
ncbi:MAG: hypothetical protein WC595_04785 [Candidatus Nanoarchaeia archaeon]